MKLTHEYMVCKISDLKYQIRVEEISYMRATELNKDSIIKDHHLNRINMLKRLVDELVKDLNIQNATSIL